MDANKRLKLIDIGYTIKPCCIHCKHGDFASFESVWGDCKKNTYYHIKHKKEKPLSINRAGSCSDFELNDKVYYQLEGFMEFLNE